MQGLYSIRGRKGEESNVSNDGREKRTLEDQYFPLSRIRRPLTGGRKKMKNVGARGRMEKCLPEISQYVVHAWKGTSSSEE